MPLPLTLFQLAGVTRAPAGIRGSILILIDHQNEYLDGPLALSGMETAITNAERVLAIARRIGTPVIHVAHRGRAGGMFDRDQARGAFITRLSPIGEETVVEKTFPNAFTATDLAERLERLGRRPLIIAGFMTHNCVSSTARDAMERGYEVTIDATSCATRALPDGHGGIVAAADVHRLALVELSDRIATIAWEPVSAGDEGTPRKTLALIGVG